MAPAADGARLILSLRIFLSSPGDVEEERWIARELIDRLPKHPFLRGRVALELVAWDDPAAPIPLRANESPQESVNAFRPHPADCDIVIVILWSRMGTSTPLPERKPDGAPFTGTEWEYHNAISSSRQPRPQVLAYRRTQPPTIKPEDPRREEKERQYQAVQAFVEEVRAQRGVNDYRDAVEFETKIASHLQECINWALRQRGGDAFILQIPPAEELQRQLSRASHELLTYRRVLPNGQWMERPELQALLQSIEDPRGSTTVLLGPPGSGKSALLAALALKLQERCIPVLAIKADLLGPEIETEEDLRRCLGLDVLPTDLLLGTARDRSICLLLDQLDALATHLDTKTNRLSVLLNLVRRLGNTPNIHTVLSARTFEYQHDVRLKSVQAQSLTLELPGWDSIDAVLKKAGIAAGGWPADAKELLRSPHALALFLQLPGGCAAPAETYQALLEQLWTERILRQPAGPRLSKLAGKIAEAMAEKEKLCLPAARFDSERQDLDALAAAGFISFGERGGKFAFSHQTVFEHVLARSFLTKAGGLGRFVLSRQESLFLRPKLWAALTYLRGVEEATYEQELRALWWDQSLRRHLRHLLVEFMGQQHAPSKAEVSLMRAAMSGASLRNLVLTSIDGSPGWFQWFRSSHSRSALQDPATAHLCIPILKSAWAFAAGDVVHLLQDCWISNADFDGHTWMVLQACQGWNEDVLALALSIVGRTDLAPWAFDHMLETLSNRAPDTALSLVRAKLDHDLEKAAAEATRRAAPPSPSNGEDGPAWGMTDSPWRPLDALAGSSRGFDRLPALAEAAPRQYVETFWPWFQRLLEQYRRLARAQEEPDPLLFYVGTSWFGPEEPEGHHDKPLMAALRIALERCAVDDAEAFISWLDRNEREPADPVQRLIARTLASSPQLHAGRALRFLREDPRRCLKDGWTRFGSAAELVRAASPFWADDEVHEFEAYVENLNLPADQDDPRASRNRLRRLRSLKLDILSALPQDRLSAAATRHVTAERRLLAPETPVLQEFRELSVIDAIMSADHMAFARDEHILNAFREVPDATGRYHPRRSLKGGNIELSSQFAIFAGRNVERAMRLIRTFEPDFGTRASAYAIEKMAEAAEPELILDAVRSLNNRGFGGDEFRGCAARALRQVVRRGVAIDDSFVSMLESWLAPYARADGDNDAGTEEQPEEARGSREGSVLWRGHRIAVSPHGNYPVLQALAQILLVEKQHDRLLRLLRAHLELPEDPGVWEGLLHLIRYLRPSSQEALAAFLSDLFGRYPSLIGGAEAAILLACMHWIVPDFVKATLTCWKADRRASAQQAYGELVALLVLVRPDLEWRTKLLDEVLASDERAVARAGAAYAAVNVFSQNVNRAAASSLLAILIPRADGPTWAGIFDLFRLVKEVTPERDWISLLQVMADYLGNAKGQTSPYIVPLLQGLLPDEGLLVARIARSLAANWAEELGDIRTSTSSVSQQLVDLALTLHRLGTETREQGTALFEDLLEFNALGVQKTLHEIDQRFAAA